MKKAGKTRRFKKRLRAVRRRTKTAARRIASSAARKRHVVIRKARQAKENVKERRIREAEALLNAQKRRDIKIVEEVFTDPYFSEHLTTNVGEGSVDIIRALYKKPQTDEKLTTRLEMKINEVRRMLNVMNGHGITKYDVTKDNSGWLIFTWRVDAEKLSEYANANRRVKEPESTGLPENCNDFFFCRKCYDRNRVILPFDSAIEYSFKCNDCGSKLEMADRENAELFVRGFKNVK